MPVCQRPVYPAVLSAQADRLLRETVLDRWLAHRALVLVVIRQRRDWRWPLAEDRLERPRRLWRLQTLARGLLVQGARRRAVVLGDRFLATVVLRRSLRDGRWESARRAQAEGLCELRMVDDVGHGEFVRRFGAIDCPG